MTKKAERVYDLEIDGLLADEKPGKSTSLNRFWWTGFLGFGGGVAEE